MHEFLRMNAAFFDPPRRKRGRPSHTEVTPLVGYTAAAAKLGVKPSHLWRVLNGQRKSQRLLARYRKEVAA